MKLTLKVVCVFSLLCGLLVIRSPAFAQDFGDEDPMSYDFSDDTTTVDPGAAYSNLANSLLSDEQWSAAMDETATPSATPSPDAPAPTPTNLAAHSPRSTNHNHPANHAGHRSSGTAAQHSQHDHHSANHAGHRSSGTTAQHSQHDHQSSGKHK